ncbi:MAG TPA: CAP domain-containing protein [Candidatus Limnocylindria bacterium]|jgi:uncharacterized protein YkwD|nr:CAP domain-containing protein [Candidatus Limnocylindria bacterium]
MTRPPLPVALTVVGIALGVIGVALSSQPRPVAPAQSQPPRSLTPSPTALAASPAASPSTQSATPAPTDAAAMLRVHNELRVAIGATAVQADDRVSAAAQRHAEYLARNGASGHEETPGEPGFSGVSVRDRLAAQGYPLATASEVAIAFTSATDGVRSLWVLPYHRLGLMHPHAVVAGWGHAEIGGRAATVGVLVYDFGSAAPERVRSPARGQRVAGTWHGEESPDVLPSGAARPVGYPVMVVYGNARTVDLRNARLTDSGGRELAYHVVPQIYERDYVAIVPASPLASGARFRVRLELTVGGADVVDEWEFESER